MAFLFTIFGFGATTVGSLLGLQTLSESTPNFFRKQTCIRKEISWRGAPEMFTAIQYWLSNHPYTQTAHNRMMWKKPFSGNFDEDVQLPGPGYHLLNTWIGIDIKMKNTEDNSGDNISSFVFWCWNFTSHNVYMESLLKQIQDDYNNDHRRIHILLADRYQAEFTWRYGSYQEIPQDNEIIMAGGARNFNDDLAKFFSPERRAKYRSQHANYQRGYILYGPPGSGKTTNYLYQAYKYKKRVHTISLANNGMDDMTMKSLCSNLPQNGCFLVFSELDTMVDYWSQEPEPGKFKGVTIGGFLDLLDGDIKLPEGTIIIITTNNINTLKEVFNDSRGRCRLRHGRIDEEILFHYIDIEMFAGRIQLAYPSIEVNQINNLWSQIEGFQISNSQLSKHLLEHDTIESFSEHIDLLKTNDSLDTTLIVEEQQ